MPTLAAPAAPAPERDSAAIEVERTFAISADVDVTVQVWISEPLETPDQRGPVRIVLAIADFNAKHLWVEKSTYSGPVETRSTESIPLGSDGVNVGLAKFLAAQILGEAETHPYVRETTGPCRVTVQPRAGKSWGAIASSRDLEISTSMSR